MTLDVILTEDFKNTAEWSSFRHRRYSRAVNSGVYPNHHVLQILIWVDCFNGSVELQWIFTARCWPFTRRRNCMHSWDDVEARLPRLACVCVWVRFRSSHCCISLQLTLTVARLAGSWMLTRFEVRAITCVVS